MIGGLQDSKSFRIKEFIQILIPVALMAFVAAFNLPLGVALVVLMIGVVGLIYLFIYPVYTVVFFMITVVLVFFIVNRLLALPISLGITLELLNIVAVLALLHKGQLKGLNTKIGKLLAIWFLLCTIELFNPIASSRVAWFHAIRHVVNNILPFFIIYSLILADKKSLSIILKWWIGLGVIGALYTLFQEFNGFPPWDYKYVTRSEMSANLSWTWGRWRKHSVYSGPMEAGVIMGLNAVLTFGLAFQDNIKVKRRVLLLVACVLSTWAMLYTGTRTATIMFILGLGIYVVLSKNKFLKFATVAFAFLIFVYIAKTGGGAAVKVMSTAFNSEDPSMHVRYNNQMRLRNYFKKSPIIGFGMGSTGYIGRKYSPGTFLGDFPPDSELVRIAIETGTLGLAFWLFLNFYALKESLDRISYAEDDFYVNLRKVFFILTFIILVGQYPQQVLNVGSVKILFAMGLAICSLKTEEVSTRN